MSNDRSDVRVEAGRAWLERKKGEVSRALTRGDAIEREVRDVWF